MPGGCDGCLATERKREDRATHLLAPAASEMGIGRREYFLLLFNRWGGGYVGTGPGRGGNAMAGSRRRRRAHTRERALDQRDLRTVHWPAAYLPGHRGGSRRRPSGHCCRQRGRRRDDQSVSDTAR